MTKMQQPAKFEPTPFSLTLWWRGEKGGEGKRRDQIWHSPVLGILRWRRRLLAAGHFHHTTPMGSRMPCSERSPENGEEKGVKSGFLEWGRGRNRQRAEKRRKEKRRKEIAKIGGWIFLSLFAARKRREEKVIADTPRLDLLLCP